MVGVAERAAYRFDAKGPGFTIGRHSLDAAEAQGIKWVASNGTNQGM